MSDDKNCSRENSIHKTTSRTNEREKEGNERETTLAGECEEKKERGMKQFHGLQKAISINSNGFLAFPGE